MMRTLKRIDNFTEVKRGLRAVTPNPINQPEPLLYLEFIEEKNTENGIDLVTYFVNNTDETILYLTEGKPLTTDIVYLDILPKQAVKIDERDLIYSDDFLTQYMLYIGINSTNAYFFNIVFKKSSSRTDLLHGNHQLTKQAVVAKQIHFDQKVHQALLDKTVK